MYLWNSTISSFYSCLGLFWFVWGGVFMQLHRTEALENGFPPQHNGASVGLCCFRKGASSPRCLLCPLATCVTLISQRRWVTDRSVMNVSPRFCGERSSMSRELWYFSGFSFFRSLLEIRKGDFGGSFYCLSYELWDHCGFCSSLFLLSLVFFSWMSYISFPGVLFKAPLQRELLRPSCTCIPDIPAE